MKLKLNPKYWAKHTYNLIHASGDRTKNLLLGSGMMAISNIIIIVTRVGLISLLTRMYTKDEFGLWISITSITAVMTNSDFGIGNALRNKLVECRIKKNGDNEAREYFFSVICFFIILAITISLILFFFRHYIPYDHLFKTDNLLLKVEGGTSLLWVQMLLLISIPFGIGPMMFFAFQETKFAALHIIITSVLGALAIGLAALLHQSITITTVLYFLVNLVCVTAGTLYFIYRRKWYSLRVINFKSIIPLVWGLLTEGALYFALQISLAFLFNSITLISTSQIGLSAASELNLAQKLYAIGLGIYLSFQNPIWAGFSDAVNRNDWHWCKATILRIIYITIPVFIFATLILTFFGNSILEVLAGQNYTCSKWLLLSLGVWTLFYLLYNTSIPFLNALGKIKMITLLSASSAFILFQIGPYFAQEYGNIGITVASSLMLFLLALAAYIQSFYLIRRNSYNKF